MPVAAAALALLSVPPDTPVATVAAALAAFLMALTSME
jgi:hypothetical protein